MRSDRSHGVCATTRRARSSAVNRVLPGGPAPPPPTRATARRARRRSPATPTVSTGSQSSRPWGSTRLQFLQLEAALTELDVVRGAERDEVGLVTGHPAIVGRRRVPPIRAEARGALPTRATPIAAPHGLGASVGALSGRLGLSPVATVFVIVPPRPATPCITFPVVGQASVAGTFQQSRPARGAATSGDRRSYVRLCLCRLCSVSPYTSLAPVWSGRDRHHWPSASTSSCQTGSCQGTT